PTSRSPVATWRPSTWRACRRSRCPAASRPAACPSPSSSPDDPSTRPRSCARATPTSRPPSGTAVARRCDPSVHRLVVAEVEPAPDDAVDRPEAGSEEDGQGEGDAHQGDEQEKADQTPEGREPERADLPAEVRLDAGAARVGSLRAVDDHC